jgi:4-amino-4-deoxy-L-arabinose transferase-like glycosyltransferase
MQDTPFKSRILKTSLLSGVTICALSLMYWGQIKLSNPSTELTPVRDWIVFSAGLFLALAALWPYLSGLITRVEAVSAFSPIRVNFVCLGLTCVTNIILCYHATLSTLYFTVKGFLALWLIGLVTFYFVFRSRTFPHTINWREIALILILFVLAASVRGYELGNLPHTLDGDEANFGMQGGLMVVHGGYENPFKPGIFDSYPLFHGSLISLTIGWLGLTVTAARLPSMLMGALSIPGIYLIGRELGGRRLGLVSALFAIGWAYHIQFSRLALNQIGDQTFGVFAFYFLLRGMRLHTIENFSLAGLMLGISQLFYITGRALPLILAVYLIFRWVVDRRFPLRRMEFAVLISGFLVATLPQNYYLLLNHLPITSHIYPNIILGGQLGQHITAGDAPIYLLNQVRASFLAFIQENDRWAWYGPGSNLMSPVGGPLFLIGVVAVIVVSKRQHDLMLLLIWGLAAVVIGSTLSITPPAYQRYITGAPAFALLVGVGILAVCRLISKLVQHQPFEQMIVGVVGASVMLGGLIFYMGVYVPAHPYDQSRLLWLSNSLGKQVALEQQAGKQVIIAEIHGSGVEADNTAFYFSMASPFLVWHSEVDLPTLLQRYPDYVGFKPTIFLVHPDRRQEVMDALTNNLALPLESIQVSAITLSEDDTLAYYQLEIPYLFKR